MSGQHKSLIDALELVLGLIAFGVAGILALTICIYYVYGGVQ